MDYIYYTGTALGVAAISLLALVLLISAYKAATTTAGKVFWAFWILLGFVAFLAFAVKSDTAFQYEQFRKLDMEAEGGASSPTKASLKPATANGTKASFADFITRPVVE